MDISLSTMYNGCQNVIYFELKIQMNNYIVRSYGDVIVVTKSATRRSSKAQSIVMY